MGADADAGGSVALAHVREQEEHPQRAVPGLHVRPPAHVIGGPGLQILAGKAGIDVPAVDNGRFAARKTDHETAQRLT